MLYSMIETAKANDLEPYAYLKTVFTKLPQAKSLEDIEALLPWNVDVLNSELGFIERLPLIHTKLATKKAAVMNYYSGFFELQLKRDNSLTYIFIITVNANEILNGCSLRQPHSNLLIMSRLHHL
jgi:hypothetical protein